MTEILIKVDDDVNSFANGDFLVFVKDKNCFKTENINDLINEKLSKYETQRQELLNELKIEKERYKTQLNRLIEVLDRLNSILRKEE